MENVQYPMSTLNTRVAALVVAFALTACNAGQLGGEPTDTPTDEASPAERPTPTEPETGTMPPETDKPVTGEVPSDLVDDMLADAADRTDVAVDDIETIRAESVTWPDGALGCPEPGQVYTQALVDGYHVVLAAGEEELDYRATADGTFRLCENPGPPGGDR